MPEEPKVCPCRFQIWSWGWRIAVGSALRADRNAESVTKQHGVCQFRSVISIRVIRVIRGSPLPDKAAGLALAGWDNHGLHGFHGLGARGSGLQMLAAKTNLVSKVLVSGAAI